MTNEFTLIREYLIGLAENYTPIGHTSSVPRYFDNHTEAIGNPPPGAIMYVSPVDAFPADEDGSQSMRLSITITIAENFTKADYNSMSTAIRNCYGHAKELLAKMTEDRIDESLDADTRCLLARFSISDAQILTGSALRDGWIGVDISFPLPVNNHLETSEELWR